MSLHIIKGAKDAPRGERSKMETMLLTPDIVSSWTIPPFQRPLKVNDKVRSIAEEIKHNGGVIEGVVTLGVISGSKTIYLIDGQHRREAALISSLSEFIADIRICAFDTMAEMAMSFVKLNTAIARMGPDDVLRGIEGSLPTLRRIRKECPFVGYDNIRRNPDTPIVGMSAMLRSWNGSVGETPKWATGSAMHFAQSLTMEECERLIDFLSIAHASWGSDPEYYRTWGGLNLTMCMWLYRTLVINRERGVRRYVVLTKDQFRKCLMSITSASDYIDWLQGRPMRERDRAPCYMRLKSIFVARLKDERFDNIKMPSPPWATH